MAVTRATIGHSASGDRSCVLSADRELGSIYLRLIDEGHDVRVFIAEPGAHDVLGGLVARIERWEAELAWLRAAGDDGLILFEDAGRGELQDQLRRDGFHVLGGSALGDRLEQDRELGQRCLRDVGFATAPVTRFPPGIRGRRRADRAAVSVSPRL